MYTLPEQMDFTKIDLGMITEAWSTNKCGKLVILKEVNYWLRSSLPTLYDTILFQSILARVTGN
jgi:hypothetical protein